MVIRLMMDVVDGTLWHRLQHLKNLMLPAQGVHCEHHQPLDAGGRQHHLRRL